MINSSWKWCSLWTCLSNTDFTGIHGKSKFFNVSGILKCTCIEVWFYNELLSNLEKYEMISIATFVVLVFYQSENVYFTKYWPQYTNGSFKQNFN